jgi:RimJ/RimL family protein N-acetyltransferase
LGYWVRESRQGQGIAGEIARLIADFGFRMLGLARIEIVVAEENYPSRRVAEKLGASFEGIARRRILMCGASIDAAIYSLIPYEGS